MTNNKVALWILTVLIIIAVGVILWLNPLGIRGVKTTEYGSALAEDFPSDFPADPNIIEIAKNQKNYSVAGGTEFVLGYYTTRPSDVSLQKISAYALSKNLTNIYDGSGTGEDGSEYFYFIAENGEKTEKVSVEITNPAGSNGALSYVEASVFKK